LLLVGLFLFVIVVVVFVKIFSGLTSACAQGGKKVN
jgi:hypothetical protein